MSLYAVVAQSDTTLLSSVTFRRPDDHARNTPTPLIGPPSLSYGPSMASCRQGAATCRSREQVGGGTRDGTQRPTNDASVLVTEWDDVEGRVVLMDLDLVKRHGSSTIQTRTSQFCSFCTDASFTPGVVIALTSCYGICRGLYSPVARS